MKTIHKLVLKAYLGPMVLTFFIVMFVLKIGRASCRERV